MESEKLHTEAIRSDEVPQLPKSNPSKEDCTEMVDVEGIDTRIFTLPREVSNYRE